MRTKAPRMARINKQNMFYSLYSGTLPVYEKDENGDPLYIVVDGVEVPVEAGTQEARYSAPVPFRAVINSELNEMHVRAWGVDQSSIYSEIVCQKGYVPLEVGAIIWRESPIEYEPTENQRLATENGAVIESSGEGTLVSNDGQQFPRQSSSDYTVVGIRTEGLTEDWYLLQKTSSDSHDNDQQQH